MKKSNFLKKWISKGIIATISILFLAGCAKKSNKKIKEIKIGYQKSGPLIYLKNKQLLEKELYEKNIKVSWVEFSSGPPILEALNTGSIDLCTTGETPPIFAQAAGIEFYYIAYEPSSPEIEGILVPENSTIKSLEELKGKKIALTKGSSAHYALTRILDKAHLRYEDITPVYLPPSDARAAFEKESVDAWIVWEPYLTSAEVQLKAKALATGLKSNTWYYLASKEFADKNPELVKTFIKNVQKADEDIKKNTEEFADMISQLTGLSKDITLTAAKHQNYGAEYLNPMITKEQQEASNTFYNLKLIPKPVQIQEAVWKPE